MSEIDPALRMYRKGVIDALAMAEALARADLRVDLAKEWGYVPAWQKGRWGVADEIAALKAGRQKLLEDH